MTRSLAATSGKLWRDRLLLQGQVMARSLPTTSGESWRDRFVLQGASHGAIASCT